MNDSTPLVSIPARIQPARVSRDVYTYVPDIGKSSFDIDPSAPQLILIFGWMDARLSPVTKYMEGYKRLYPFASQILILSRQEAGWTRKSKNLEIVRPAVDLVQSHGLFGATPPNILVHVLSNGGGFQLILVSELLNAIPRGLPPPRRPAMAIVFDSVPGEAGLGHALHAHTLIIRSRLIKFLISGPLILLYAAVMGSAFLLGRPSPFTVLREGLQQPELIPFSDKQTPRLYIYSHEDQMVQGSSIKKHIAEAREKGFAAEGECFQGSAHVAHLRKDPARYWDVISKHWENAVKATELWK